MSPPPPPPQPPHHTTNFQLLHHHNKPTNLSDLFFAAVSIFFLFSSSSSSSSSCPLKPQKRLFPINPRKFFKNPFMSLSRTTHSHNFPTPQSLSDWLQPRLPSDSFSSWGVNPGTKNIHNLWLELYEGEISLIDSIPPLRTVRVVTLRVINPHYKNLVLIESHQELSDGSVRERCRPLSEKIKPDESPETAVLRAVREELGSVLGEVSENVVRIVEGSYKEKVEERNSVSYPGLPAKYVLHCFDVIVEGLPEGEFCTEEVDEYGRCEERVSVENAVSVKRHFWKWVSSDLV